jgi:hypothetical protein
MLVCVSTFGFIPINAQVNQISLPSKTAENNVKLSNLTDRIEYVSLETTKDFPIKNIRKIVMTPVSILVFDDRTGNVLAFSKMGRFIAKIGNKGNRSGEYSHCFDFTTDPSGENIYVLTVGDTILHYDAAGKYLGCIKTPPLKFMNFQRLNKNFISYIGFPNSVKTNGFSCFQFNDKGKVRKKYLFRNLSGKTDTSREARIGWNFYQDTVSFWEASYDTIYHYTERSGVQPRYSMKTNGNYKIGNVMENPGFVLFSLDGYNGSSTVLYDKKNKKFFGTGKANAPMAKNDLDIGPDFVLNFFSQDYFIDVLTYSNFKPAIEAAKTLPAENNPEIISIAQKLNENSNPVLRLIKVNSRFH